MKYDIAASWQLHSDYKIAPSSASLSFNISHGMLSGKEITRYEIILRLYYWILSISAWNLQV
jgi:hypothetical protein